jgi:hypothetical protein
LLQAIDVINAGEIAVFFIAAVVVLCMWSHHEALGFSTQQVLLPKNWKLKLVLTNCMAAMATNFR